MSALVIVVIVFMAGMLGVSIGYHRYLSHKSFKPARWFELLIVYLGLPAGTPIQWAGNHRAHHRHADTELDPHSPHFGGFWWSHNGWYINSKNPVICFLYALGGPLRSIFDGYHRPRTNQQYVHLAQDIAADPVFSFISRPWVYFFLVLTHTLGAFALAYLFAGITGLWLAYGCYLFVYNIGDGVDSWGHLWGPRNPNSKHLATNHWALGILAFGDGWHGNHHDRPNDPRHGKGPFQIDLSFQTLKLLSYVGVVELPNQARS